MSANTIQIHFDGGCKPTNPGNCYGSFEVLLDEKPISKLQRFDLGWGTNNEAEFKSLIIALDWTIKALTDAGNRPSDFDLEIVSDSTVVVNRLCLKNRTKKTEPQRRMADLTEKCLKRTILFNGYKARWMGRLNNVARFGH